VAFPPPRSGRTYRLAPLSYRERNRLRRAVRAEGGDPPDRAVMLGVLRQCLAEMAPANLAEALTWVNEAEAAPDDKAAQSRLAVLERAARTVPAYAELVDAHMRYQEAQPWITARFALRGWAGEGLPPFARDGDMVPESLMEMIPAAELDAIASRAMVLIWLGPSAEKNSEAPSPSPASPEPTAAD
jgi:hypothetical protein